MLPRYPIIWNFVFLIVQAGSEVQYMPQGLTWLEASTKCGEKGLEDNDEKLKASDIPVESAFWIGKAIYRELSPWIEVLGCTSSTDNADKAYTVASIGHCIIKCGIEKVFGYKNKGLNVNCVCFAKGIPTAMNSACHVSSDFLVHTYYNGTIPVDIIDPGNCVTLCCGSCRTIQTHMLVGTNCKATSTNTIGTCKQFSGKYQQWGLNYNNSRNYCWQNNRLLLPSSFCGNHSAFLSGVKAWTNVFRETIDIEKSVSNHNPIVCQTGVFHRNENGTKKIYITYRNCNADVKWYICKGRNPRPSQAKYTTMSLSGISSTQIVGNQETTEIILNGTRLSMGAYEKVTNECHQGFTLTTLIGAVIGGIIGSNLICFGIVLVFRKLRKHRLYEEKGPYDDLKMNNANDNVYCTVID